jgi:hypothetical protein
MKFHFIHPHPNPWSPLAPPKAGKPIPSREREVFDFLRDHQYSMFKTFEIFYFGHWELFVVSDLINLVIASEVVL